MFPQIEHRPALKTGLVGMELETRDIRFETGDISFEIICKQPSPELVVTLKIHEDHNKVFEN